MQIKVSIRFFKKGLESREISFSTNHQIKIVEMWIKARNWDFDDFEGSWQIEDVSFNDDGKTENCIWDGIINKWMLERNT